MPGLTLTETNVDRVPSAELEPFAAVTPLRRLLRHEEIAATIVLLGSAANTTITGEIVRASGDAR
jgi:3-oxoacyl-[acyl-carrier protein] reductase